MSTVASLPAKLTKLVARLRDGDWNMRTPEELAECVADAIMEALATTEHGEVVITTDDSGRCVAVTRQDGEGRILSTIWEASEHGSGEAFGWYCARDKRFYRAGEWGNAACEHCTSLYTTPPSAPAAEQGDGMCYCQGPDVVCPNCEREAAQPEARGVEGMRNALEAIRQYGSDTLSGRVDGPSDREWFKEGVREMTRRAREALATPNPVRAEQPDSRSRVRRIAIEKGEPAPRFDEQPEGEEAGRMAIRLLVAAGHVTEAKANEALCIAHGFEPGPLAPAAPVGVDVYEKGWINAAKWAQRVDLISDIGSAAYERDKTTALAGKEGAR